MPSSEKHRHHHHHQQQQPQQHHHDHHHRQQLNSSQDRDRERHHGEDSDTDVRMYTNDVTDETEFTCRYICWIGVGVSVILLIILLSTYIGIANNGVYILSHEIDTLNLRVNNALVLLNDTIAALNSSLNTAQTADTAALNRRIDAAFTALTGNISALVSLVNATNTNVAQVNSTVLVATNAVNGVSANVALLNNSLITVASAINTVNASVVSEAASVTTLTTNLNIVMRYLDLVQCPNGCSGNGACNHTTGLCSCAYGWNGADCSNDLRPTFVNPILLCVNQTSASIYEAFYGYRNTFNTSVTFAAGSPNNLVTNATGTYTPITTFSVGTNGSFPSLIPFQFGFNTTSNASWKLGNTTVTATASSPRCFTVQPIAVCYLDDGIAWHAQFEYNNPNYGPVNITYGENNSMIDNFFVTHYDQPTIFYPGLDTTRITVQLYDYDTSEVTWTLDGNTATVTYGASPACT